jgi:SAM-dependent methyltransferase
MIGFFLFSIQQPGILLQDTQFETTQLLDCMKSVAVKVGGQAIRPSIIRLPRQMLRGEEGKNAVRSLYKTVGKTTGNTGGNSIDAPIYGELTLGSMQLLIDVMIERTGLSGESRFIDIGCGLGKPSLHVAQAVGVEFSFGIEVDRIRYFLGMNNLHQVLREATQRTRNGTNSGDELRLRACYFALGDITEAASLDPFTHVYMFDVG